MTDSAFQGTGARPFSARHSVAGQDIQLERRGAGRRRTNRRGLLDLIWKISSSSGSWTATLRNDPSVVVTADGGEELAHLTRNLTLAILQGHGEDALRCVMAGQAGTGGTVVATSGSKTV
jgi:hypothetical protein